MGPKRSIDLTDIQDDSDRALVSDAKRRKKKNSSVKLSFLDDSDYVHADHQPRVLLSKKVKQVEDRLGSWETKRATLSSATDVPYAPPVADEDLPVVTEAVDAEQETPLKSLANSAPQARALLKAYEKLDLHRLFSSAEENCSFRLFLYAVSYNQGVHWHENGSKTEVFRSLLTQRDVQRHILSETGGSVAPDAIAHSPALADNSGAIRDAIENGNHPVLKRVEQIHIPKRIWNALPR